MKNAIDGIKFQKVSEAREVINDLMKVMKSKDTEVENLKNQMIEQKKYIDTHDDRIKDRETGIIKSLMNQMTKIASDPQLLWKNQPTIFGSILFLLNACELDKSLLTVDCVQLYVDSLVNENINVRRVS